MNMMKSQEEMESYDYLTGLPMRNRGETAIAHQMQQRAGCLVFLDMDNLKKINDIYGHKAGDRTLKLLGNLLKKEETKENGSVACRLGGDEFLLFLTEEEKERAKACVSRIFQNFKEETEKDVEMRVASLSAGLCMSKEGDTFEECYMNADKALYYVKQNGKERQTFSFISNCSKTICRNQALVKTWRQLRNLYGRVEVILEHWIWITEILPRYTNI